MRVKKDGKPSGFELPQGVVVAGKKIRLREKKLSDARKDYKWQSDPELSRLDAAPELRVSYPLYLLEYSEQLHTRASRRFPFAIETLDGTHIGNCTCYDVDKKKAEAQLGIMIGERYYWDRGYGTDVVTTLVNHIFTNMNVVRVYLKTLEWNLRAQHCFRNCGFTQCGKLSRNGNHFLIMDIKREQWEKQRDAGTKQ